MEKCQHGAKITHFCIYEYCAAKQTAGCQNCLKKYHSHVGQGEAIRIEDVDHLVEKFNVENSVKPKCRQFQENVFSFFTQVKTEISQTIDIVCKGMVNKIGYPLLSNLNHLSSYKRIKNKEYKKLTPKQLKKIYVDCRGLDMGSVTIRERELYIEKIVQNFTIIEGMQKLMKEYENLAKRLCKNFKHDSSAYKKIEDLKKYLNTVLKLDRKQSSRMSNYESKMTESLLETSPSDDQNFIKNNSSPTQTKQQRENSKIRNQQAIIKPQPEKISSRSKYTHLRSFSIEKEVKINDLNAYYDIKITQEHLNAYESKQKEISERKQKLMKMMSIKEKSIGKTIENNSGLKSNQPALIPPPLLKYQKNQNETPNEKPKKSQQTQEIVAKNSNVKKSTQTSLRMQKMQTPQKKEMSTKNISTSPRRIIHSSSVRSLNQETASQNQKNQAKNDQEDDEQKYKYGMGRLPSSDSNSSDTQNFFKSYINSITKNSKKKQNIDESLGIEDLGKQKSRRDRMIESSPGAMKIQQNNSVRLDEIVKDEEKSAALYLAGLEKNNPDQRIRYLKAALSYCPRNISAAEHLSSLYLQKNKAKQCLDLCNEYLSLLTKLSQPQLKRNFVINKSASLNLLGRYSQSIILLESQIMHFEEAKMYKNLGDAYYFVGINEKCQYNYQKAIRMDPKLDEAMYNLAACIFTQGNFHNAEIYITKAIEIDPKNVDYQILKKEVQKRLADIRKENQQIY